MGIIEVDYFGLQFTGSKGENLWLNLRNRICQQMDNVAPCRLRLRVKFFVEPHLILQEQTRYVMPTFLTLRNETYHICYQGISVHLTTLFLTRLQIGSEEVTEIKSINKMAFIAS